MWDRYLNFSCAHIEFLQSEVNLASGWGGMFATVRARFYFIVAQFCEQWHVRVRIARVELPLQAGIFLQFISPKKLLEDANV